jgi:hypothetical protein
MKPWNHIKNPVDYLAHVMNPQYLQRNFCFDFFNDSENKF